MGEINYLILKNIINYFNLVNLLMYSTLLYQINIFLITTNIRNKFYLFFINILTLTSVGFYYGLDGLMMLFLISELTIILVFITIFSQLYTYTKSSHSFKYQIVFIVPLLIINYSYYSVDVITYSIFYNYTNIVVNDFYYIYNTYFEKQILLSIITLYIITLYSVFFILVYYNIKTVDNNKYTKKFNIMLLRKQNLIHQNNYNTKARLFKNS